MRSAGSRRTRSPHPSQRLARAALRFPLLVAHGEERDAKLARSLDEGLTRDPEELGGFAAGDRPLAVQLEHDQLPRHLLNRLVGAAEQRRKIAAQVEFDRDHAVLRSPGSIARMLDMIDGDVGSTRPGRAGGTPCANSDLRTIL